MFAVSVDEMLVNSCVHALLDVLKSHKIAVRQTIGEFNMNDPSTHAAMVARQQKLNRQQTHTGLVFLVVTVAIVFIIPEYLTPPYDVMWMSFGSAALFSVFFYLYRESLRSRSGSLVPARCLVAALWMSAAVTAVVSLIDWSLV